MLLVDADLRNPSQHTWLNTDNSTGLSNYLTGGCTPPDVMQKIEANLAFIASGPLPPNAADLLAKPRLLSLMAIGAEVFDLIVIDGPPVLGLADAQLLSSATAATVFVVGANSAKAGNIRGALRRLQLSRGLLVGAVMTKYDAKTAGYGYGSDYGYSYGYGYGQRTRQREAWSGPITNRGSAPAPFSVARDGVMDDLGTVMMALDLLRVPSRARLIRSAPLPSGVVTLLRIADGDEALTHQAVAATGVSAALICEAADFFIQQALLHPEADAYRVLGTAPGATTAELRRNMALLMRWLHPDHRKGDRSVFAHRVTRAWNELKTDERRTAYDRSRRLARNNEALSRNKAKTIRKKPTSIRLRNDTPHTVHPNRTIKFSPPSGLLRRVLLLLLGRSAY